MIKSMLFVVSIFGIPLAIWWVLDGLGMIEYFRIHFGVRIYWFINRWIRQWNNFKDFIGVPRDPRWLGWFVDKTIYPHEFFDKLNKEVEDAQEEK